MLYKKKECERRRRYKMNTIKDKEFLQQANVKHRCSYCRGLYYDVYYYRGYMLCSFCFVKKSVLNVILFSTSCKEITNEDIVEKEGFAQQQQKLYNKRIEECDNVKNIKSTNVTKTPPSPLPSPEPIPFTLEPNYLPHYDRDYWIKIALSTFL